jgi:hypothetical protein
MGKTYDEVLDMKADEIYMTMLLDFEQSEYQKRLMKIKERNRKATQ